MRIKRYRQYKRLSNGLREYIVYRSNIPIEKAKEMNLENDELLLILAKKPEWYHLINWNDRDNQEILWNRLSKEVKIELCSLKLAPKELCSQEYIPLILHISREELEKLRIDPRKPLTLNELEEKLTKKLITLR